MKVRGPEHSSARLERFLQLCAEHNIQVCLPTTSAQVFHMLRKQVLCPMRKPLVVMSPKSLLRHKETVSSLEELAEGSFQVVLDEIDADIEPAAVRKVIVCSGKVYYDLLAERRERELKDIAIIRLEQLYPFPADEYDGLFAALSKREGNRMEPGRAEESRRLVLKPAPFPASYKEALSRNYSGLRRSRCLRSSGSGLPCIAQSAAREIPRRGNEVAVGA
jgi:2-oxoglutarate dehydrogenase complex dehydrogenase (E1) component-like enzyme